MNKIDGKLKQLNNEKKLGLMTHVVLGYPSLDATEKLVKLMSASGVDLIELQIPFSDPLADGPTIMKACEVSLQNGTKVKDAFEIAKKLSQAIDTPLLFMAYYNTLFKYGVEKFCKDSKDAGISGLIVPDIPIEEETNESFMKYVTRHGLHHIRVLSPASTEERIKKNARVANGFVYFTSRQGITGAKSSLDPKLISNLNAVKKFIKTPLAVGFGISKKEHLKALEGHAELAVVGSAILDIINESKQDYLKKVEKFLKDLR